MEDSKLRALVEAQEDWIIEKRRALHRIPERGFAEYKTQKVIMDALDEIGVPYQTERTWVIGLIYRFDTSTGVCPSLHVAYSLGIASTWLKMKDVSKLWKAFVTVAVFFICISVAFVKQHSVADIFAALPVGLLAEAIVFGGWWKEKFRRNKA